MGYGCHWNPPVSLLLTLCLAGSGLWAQQDPIEASGGWGRVAALAPGQSVRVEVHKGLGKSASGKFLSSDAQGVTVRTGKGDQFFTRDSVKKVRAVQVGREYHALMGLTALGVGNLIMVCLYEPIGSHSSTEWKPGIPALIGIGIGLPLGLMGRAKTIYSAPRR